MTGGPPEAGEPPPGPGPGRAGPEPGPPAKPSFGALAFAGMGVSVAACVGVGVALGILADARLHTAPLPLLAGLVLGCAAAVAAVSAQVKRNL